MSMKLDSKEILKYLNGLGYRNISSQQLKEFIRDLKILIKHDLKKQAQKANQENIRPNDDKVYFLHKNRNYDRHSFDPNLFAKQLSFSEDSYDSLSSTLRSSTTISSREESTPEETKVISIEIVKPKEKKTVSVGTDCICLDESKDKHALRQEFRATVDTSVNKSESKSTVSQDSKTKKCNKNEQKRVNVLKPRKSFIKPRAPVNNFAKCDPVALYQKYQKEWKKQKLPGEDKHYGLRWAIRERMLGEPSLGV